MKKRILAILLLIAVLCIMTACNKQDTRPVQKADIEKDITSIASVAGLTEEELEELIAENNEEAPKKTSASPYDKSSEESEDVKTAARNAITRLQTAKTEEERSTIVHEFTEKASTGETTVVIARSTSDQKSKSNKGESKEANSAGNNAPRSEAKEIAPDPVDTAYDYTQGAVQEPKTQVTDINGGKLEVPDPYEGRSMVWVIDKEFESEVMELRYQYGDASNTWRLVDSDTHEILVSDADEAVFAEKMRELPKEALSRAIPYKPGEAVVLGAEWVIVKELVPEEGHWEWVEND